MKLQQYESLMALQANRRTMLKGATALSVLAATGGLTALAPKAFAQSVLPTVKHHLEAARTLASEEGAKSAQR